MNTKESVGSFSLAEEMKLSCHHYGDSQSFGTNVVKTFTSNRKQRVTRCGRERPV